MVILLITCFIYPIRSRCLELFFLFAAAAWYMAKRRFYNKGVKNQLLALLLKEYPKKFAMKNNVVQFLESYSPVVSFCI